MTQTAPILLSISLVFLLGACGGGGSDPVTPAPDPTGMDPLAEVPETLEEGIWETACFPAGSPAASRRYVVTVTGTAFRFGDTTYGDQNCDDESALRDIDTQGTFAERLPEDGRRIEDGKPVDLSIDQVTLTPRLLQVAMRYNMTMLCDTVASEWVPGVSQDISGCVDETGTIDVDTTAPRTDFNLLLVDEGSTEGNTREARPDDRLLFGTVSSQTDPERRPTMVSEEVVFTRRAGSP